MVAVDAQLRHDLRNLKTAVRALEKNLTTVANVVTLGASQIERNAVDLGSLAIGSLDADLTWGTAFPDTAYIVIPTVITGSAAQGNVSVVLKAKTTGGATVTVKATTAVGACIIDALAVRA